MMEIVIKIPEEEYRNICLMSKNGIGMALYDWIANGTPLPKGHGRLIDADAFGKELHRYTEAPYQYALKVFNDAPTIIEADKE
jgi:hypothetical protein